MMNNAARVIKQAIPNIDEVSEDELMLVWTLSPDEIALTFKACRGEDYRFICFAIQLLCVLRHKGRFLNDYHQVPYKVIQYLSKQLDIQSVQCLPHLLPEESEYAYRQKIMQALGFVAFDEEAYAQLSDWLTHQLNGLWLSQADLVARAETFLKQHAILLPTAKSLGKKVAQLKQSTLTNLYQQIAESLPQKKLKRLDKLIKPKGHRAFSSLQQFKRSPPEASAKVINHILDQLAILLKLGVHKLDLTAYDQAFIKTLALLVNTYDASAMRRIRPAAKRYAYLICFLSEAYKSLIDNIIELNAQFLTKKKRLSQHAVDKQIKPLRRKSTASLDIVLETTRALIQHVDPENTSLTAFQSTLDIAKVRQAIEDCSALNELEKHGPYQTLARKYDNLRQYTQRFYQLDFKAAKGAEPLLKGIRILRKLNEGSLSAIPCDAPIDFVPDDWRTYLKNEQGVLQQKPWELALYFSVKKALASGDIYLPHSRHHRDFWQTIYTQEVWREKRIDAYQALKLPNHFKTVLKQLKQEYLHYFEQAKQSFSSTSFAYIGKHGELKLRKDDALPLSDKAKQLKQLLESRLPLVRIEKLLADVDSATHFSTQFEPLPGYEPKQDLSLERLYAALVAHGTNIGLYGMAHSAEGISIEPLRTTSRWYIHDEALKKVNAHLVNAVYLHPLSKLYGDGQVSSSDGQRYRIRSSSHLASFYPRFFGYYDKAVTLYTHTSNQYSVFNTQVISCSAREATYVLAGLLTHGSLLNPTQHMTDTHGFTEHVFALCFLLGFSFQPRLKDITYQQLYKLDKTLDITGYDNLFSGVAEISLIEEQWDAMVRVAASLRNGIAPAHIIVQKLASRTASDRLAKALTALGRLIKTIYIFRYLADESLRYRVHLQLNRGEMRHQLAQHIFFADQGVFKTRDYEQIMNKASCLSLLSNAILYWNTLHIDAIVKQLKSEGYAIADEDLVKISPLLFRHIIVHGTYHFKAAAYGL